MNPDKNPISEAAADVDRLRNQLHDEMNLVTRHATEPIIQALNEAKGENSRLMRELQEMRSENSHLKEMLEHATRAGEAGVGQSEKNPIVIIDRTEDLRKELVHLRQQYDNVLREKEQASRQYQEHYRKWRNFKKWLANDRSGRFRAIANDLFHSPSPARLQKVRRSFQLATPDSDPEHGDSDESPHPRDDQTPSTRNPGPIIIEPGPSSSNRQYHRPSHAQDCECCRNHYRAVDPLPSRLMPPPWRTPTKSRNVNDQQGVEDHQHQISKHRHQEDASHTPPGYWNIGFPDTQEIQLINKQAQLLYKN